MNNQYLLDHKVEVVETANGLRIINVRIPNYPIASSSVWVNAGSSKDPIEKQGLSHFFEHVLFVRTKKFPDRQKRLEEIEKNGMVFNAFTTIQSQHYFYVHSLDKSELALQLLLDGLRDSVIEEQDVEREKAVIISEEKENRDNPSEYIWRVANRGLWGEKKLGKDFFGTRQSINSITREDIELFFKTYFCVENLQFVFINSTLPLELQKKMLELCDLPFRETKSPVLYTKPSTPVIYKPMKIDTVQVNISFLTSSAFETRDKIIQDFVCSYLASGWTSRLIQRLRVQESLTYWVDSDSCVLEQSGYVRFNLSTDQRNLKRIFEIVEEEIAMIRNAAISKEALLNHKNKFVADVLRGSTSYDWLMQWYGYPALLTGEVLPVKKYCEEIRSITAGEVQKFALRYLTEDRRCVAFLSKERPQVEAFRH